ncbi:MAG: hypothetical protein ABFS14_05425 [Gemmatimonadota bacterium]
MLPTVGSLVTLAAFAGVLGPLAFKLFAGDGDVGRHIRLGTHILETGSIPRADLFSHTMAGEEFIPYEWLSEIIFAQAHLLLGLAGVALLTALLFAGTNSLVYWTTVRLGAGRPLAAVLTAYSIVLQSSHLLPRPHLFTTLLSTATLALLLEYRRSYNARWLWALPPMFAVWANLHGGFLIGFMLLGVFGAEVLWRVIWDRDRQASQPLRVLTLVGLLCVAATLVNPVGPIILLHTTGYLGEQFLVDFTQEYQSPSFHHLAGKLFLYNILFGLVLLLSGRARPSFAGSVLFVLWLSAALFASRNIPIFSVVLTPFLALWATRVIQELAESPSRSAGPARRFRDWSARMTVQDARLDNPIGLIAVLIVVGAVFLAPGRRDAYHWAGDVFPVEAVPWVQAERIEGRVFNQFTWGGYLLYSAPEIPVFIDGQTDFYGEQLTRNYLTMLSAQPGWDSLLVKHQIDWTLTETKQPINEVLALRTDWQQVYKDSTATVFVRQP